MTSNCEKVTINFKKRTNTQKKYSYLPGSCYYIDGIPGIGKSEFGKSAEYHLTKDGIPTKYFPEYVPGKFLNLYLRNDEYQKKYALPFQVVMAERRLIQAQKAVEFAKQGGFAIVDGPLIRDTAFEHFLCNKGFINKEEHEAYVEIMEEANGIDEPTKVVFLDGNVHTSVRRIAKRGNAREIERYTPEYLFGLRNTYSNIYTDINVTTINYDCDCWMDGDYLSHEWVYKLLDAIKTGSYENKGLSAYPEEVVNEKIPNWWCCQ